MREIPWEEEFDAVLSWFTSLGYFEHDASRRVLEGVHAALRPGGICLADLNHRDWLLSRFVSDFVVERGDDLMVDRHTSDPITGRIYNERTVVRDGRLRRFQFFTRLFSFTELRTWLQDAGFTEIRAYGDDREGLTAASRRLRTVARAVT